MNSVLYKRSIVDQITPYLGDDTVIVLNGARQVGKTHILKYLQNYLEKQKHPCLYLDLEDERVLEVLDLGVTSFRNYLQSLGYLNQGSLVKTYIFVDEIQYLASPSSFLKQIADHHKDIQLIVSGSSSFEIKSKFKDSLVGRTTNFEVFNLSFAEFLRFKNLDYRLDVELLPG
ncbi:MAG: AAA family ATPase [bacterium]